MRAPGLLAGGCAAILALAGCGGGAEGEIRDTLGSFAKAREEGDAEAACERLVAIAPEGERREGPELREEGEGEAEGEDQREEGEGEREEAGHVGEGEEESELRPGACERAFASVVASARGGLRSYEQDVEDVEVHGERASARVRVHAVRSDGSEITRTITYRLAERDGRWRILLYPE